MLPSRSGALTDVYCLVGTTSEDKLWKSLFLQRPVPILVPPVMLLFYVVRVIFCTFLSTSWFMHIKYVHF